MGKELLDTGIDRTSPPRRAGPPPHALLHLRTHNYDLNIFWEVEMKTYKGFIAELKELGIPYKERVIDKWKFIELIGDNGNVSSIFFNFNPNGGLNHITNGANGSIISNIGTRPT